MSDKSRLVNALKGGALPGDFNSWIRRRILDTLGAALAGAQTVAGQQLVEEAMSQKESKESTIISRAFRTSASTAFKVNSRLGRLYDFRDMVTPYHPGRLVTYAALSAAEKLSLTTEEVIAAVAFTNELILQTASAIRKVIWPPEQSILAPQHRPLINLRFIGSMAKSVLSGIAPDSVNTASPLVDETLTLLEEGWVSELTSSTQDQLFDKVKTEVSHAMPPKSDWRDWLTVKTDLRPGLIDQFVQAPANALAKALHRSIPKLEIVERIALSGLPWLELLNQEKFETAKARIASLVLFYLSGVEPDLFRFLPREPEHPAVLDMSNKIMWVKDLEDLVNVFELKDSPVEVRVLAKDGISRVGRAMSRMRELLRISTDEEFGNWFEAAASGLIGECSAKELIRKLLLSKENLPISKLMKTICPSSWPIALAKSFGWFR